MNRGLFLKTGWILGIFFAGSLLRADSGNGIRIYLPEEKTVLSETFNLGQVAVVLGDEEQVRAANQVSLGRFATAGHTIAVDRTTILSRLASAGIDTKSVTFNGSEVAVVRRDQNVIGADRFLKTAQEFMENQLKGRDVQSLKLIRPPQDFSFSTDCTDIGLVPQMSSRQNGQTRRVTVSVMQGDIELNRQEIVFAIQYTCRRLVAAENLPAGTVISASNARIEEYPSTSSPDEALSVPYGMVAKRTIERGTVISDSLVEPAVSPVLVKPRQRILMKLDTGALFISAPGIAMEEGRAGEIIRVQRGSDKTRDERIVLGKVMPDGTLEPVL